VVLAIKVPSIINFEEVLSLKAIKYLEGKAKEVFDFMNTFTLESGNEFEQKLKTYENLMKQEGLDKEEVIRKKSYVRICSLPLK